MWIFKDPFHGFSVLEIHENPSTNFAKYTALNRGCLKKRIHDDKLGKHIELWDMDFQQLHKLKHTSSIFAKKQRFH